MWPRKRPRTSTAAPPPEAATLAAPTLPPDLVLEIIARSDAMTLVRYAACCKPLRRDILSPAFIRRVCHGDGAGGAAVVPPRLFGFLPSQRVLRAAQFQGSRSPPPAAFSLAHPATSAAAHFSKKHLAPLLSRGGRGDLLACSYYPLTSRNGLLVLRRGDTNTSRESGICVFDPMVGDRMFVPDPPEMDPYSKVFVLLTASDGIGCSFLLLKVEFIGLLGHPSSIKVQTVSSDATAGRKWSPATSVPCKSSYGSYLHPCRSAVILSGTIHWLMYSYTGWEFQHVLTYKVGATTAGRIELPMARLPESYRNSGDENIRLASTSDEKLAMIFREGLKIYVWLLSADADWALHTVIDTETPLRSLVPEVPQPSPPFLPYILFESLGERSGVLLFTMVKGCDLRVLIVLDIEKKEMHRVHTKIHTHAFPFEVELESRLSAMKTF